MGKVLLGQRAVICPCSEHQYCELILEDIAYVSPPKGSEGTRTQIKENDLLITITGANVAKAAWVNFNLDEAYVSQHVALARLVEPDFSPYLHLWTVSEENGRAHLLREAYGNGKPGLNLDNIRQMAVAVAPIKEQREMLQVITEAMESVEGVSEVQASLDSSLSQLDQSILAKAFRGELVPQDPNDEPASVLLERIRAEREARGPKQKRKAKK